MISRPASAGAPVHSAAKWLQYALGWHVLSHSDTREDLHVQLRAHNSSSAGAPAQVQLPIRSATHTG